MIPRITCDNALAELISLARTLICMFDTLDAGLGDLTGGQRARLQEELDRVGITWEQARQKTTKKIVRKIHRESGMVIEMLKP
jgi:hypothetical protein